MLFLIHLVAVAFLLSNSSHPFLEYMMISHFYTINQTLVGLVIENVTEVFPNGSVEFEYYSIDLNNSEYIGPIIEVNNLSNPTSLYVFTDVGNKVVYRAAPFYLVGEEDGVYIYKNVQNLEGVEVITYYYVNSSGVPSKIVFLQYGVNGELVGNTTYVLYSSSLLNPNAKLYFPSGLTRVQGGVDVQLSNTARYPLIENAFTSALILSAVILVSLKVLKKYGNKNG